MEVTASVEDYLKTIWKLGSRGERVTPATVAAGRDVSGPSASIMLRRLVEAGLVVRGPASEILLSPRGEAAALRVVRRHRLLETFLVQVCGLSWDEVDEEAEVLEHVLSPRLEARIDDLLGHPARDPHGDPIPAARADRHDDDWPDPLTGAAEGVSFLVERVSDRDPAALRHLAAAGVRPGAVLEVGRQEPFGGPRWVTVQPMDGTATGTPAVVALAPGLVALVHGRGLVAARGGS